MKSVFATIAAAAVLSSNAAFSAAIIYEPFAQTPGSLNGQATSTTGLTGNWTATVGTYPLTVTGGTATYGSLPTAGNRIFAGSNPIPGQVNTNASASAGTTLYNAGLLNDGAHLWFSFIYTVPVVATSTNSNFTFALGTAGLSTTGTLGAGQSAVGFSISRNNRPTASYWNNAIASGAKVNTQNNDFAVGTSHLIVGEIIWGASSETINIYLPGTNLAIPSVYDSVTTAGNINQNVPGYSVVSFGGKNATANPQGIDEIRFGASYQDVIGAPEPGSLALMGIGGLLIARRRRA